MISKFRVCFVATIAVMAAVFALATTADDACMERPEGDPGLQ